MGAAVAVGACVGTGVDPCGVGVSPGVGAADVEADPDDVDADGDGAVVVLTADGDEQAIATTRVAATPERRSRITLTLATSQINPVSGEATIARVPPSRHRGRGTFTW